MGVSREERRPGAGRPSTAANSFVFEQLADATPGQAQVPGEPIDPERVLAQARARAHDEGFEQGYREGLELVQAEGGQAVAALLGAREQFEVAAAEHADQIEREAVKLALKLAQKILSAAVEADPERVLDAIRGGLRRLVDRAHVTLLVNPDDLELVRDSLASMATELGAIERLEAQAERRVARGGAVIRTSVGEIDATIESQLERAREIVLRELGSSAESQPEGPVGDPE